VSEALRTSRENLFGSDHHLATSSYGTLDVVADTSPDDVRAALAARWAPSSCALVVVGDISAEALDPLAAEAFAGFVDRPGTNPTIPSLSERPPREVIAFHDGDEAAYVVLSDRAPHVDHDDSLAFSAVMSLAAGHFSSRINTSLRLEHTLTYGAHASYFATRFAGTFSLSMTVKADEVDDALEILEQEVRGIVDTPPTDAEMRRIRILLESKQRAALDDNSSTARRIAYGWVRGEPLDLLNERIARIRALSAEDLHRVAREWIRPAQIPIVVVGDLNMVDPWDDLDHFGRVRIFTFQYDD
jgi:zinc protease